LKETGDIKLLLKQIALDDHNAFNRLFTYYSKQVNGVVKKITGSQQIAEEIVQDTFLKVWLKRTSLPGIENFEAWLYVVARNYTLKALQSKHVRNTSSVEDGTFEKHLITEGKTDWKVREAQYDQLLKTAIDRLPLKQKETYLLIKENQYSRNEVAALLNVSPETVKYNLTQAMKNIRAYCIVYFEENSTIIIFFIYIAVC
jgi:RNA polymerase sigma factor (sigma-70 family)